MLQLASPDLHKRWQKANARLLASRWQAAAAGVDVEARQNLQVLQEDRATAEAELSGVQADLELYAPKAPFAGRLLDIDPDYRPGVWVSRNERLATLVRDGAWLVETYLDEDAVRRVAAGDGGRFFSDGLAGPYLELTVLEVDRDATRILPDGLLASHNGGSVLTRDRNGQHVPERSVFRVVLAVTGDPESLSGRSWRGQVVIRGRWEAPGLRFLRAAAGLLWRESGF
jgi:putative peptide zinc metalloprotease protein